MKKILSFLFLLTIFVSSFIFPSDKASPIGFWKSIDDKTGKAKSVIKIKQTDGSLQGKILKLLDREGKDPNPKCKKCTDELRKNQPIIGMKILSNLKKDGNEWSGGKILDPKNGKEYKCYIKVLDNGKKLKVRGYIGFSLFGRTQYWYRIKNPNLITK